MNQEEAKRETARLVEKYEQIKKSGTLKKYNEAETCKEFILPLFKALGWDTESKAEVSAEEHTSKTDRSDYGFYLKGWPKFYLEAKKLSADIHDEKFAKQATTYSWNKGIDWAVLTDFESLIVFSAQDISEHLSHRLFFEIKYSDYLERFDQLWWLSKESFEQNVLDKEAEKVGKKLQKVSVTDTLYKDLNDCRWLLLKSFHNWNREIPNDLLEEGVQKLLDRLIFIRVAEDRGLEQPTLIPMLRATGGSSSAEFFKQLVDKFRELDDIYNSNLFAKHTFENWQEYDGATEKVIEILHGKTGFYEYDFQAIPADILGSVYENYLGYKLSQSDKGMEVSKDSRKRKEQGIYYTPTYIVDYIVQNALKPVLDKCESAQDLKAIKVLDPACGSGSFLIQAMEMIYQKYLEFGANPGEMTKITILLDNIFGVDLDEQAVEIARLNLLINALDSRMKLPSLDKNIKNGNSLISGTDAELEKAFGKNFRDKKPFNWQEQFPQVFDRENPGFDVIIGNPPYVSIRDQESTDRGYIRNTFSFSGGADLYVAFIERALGLLRKDGNLGFICPNKFFGADYGKKIRKHIQTNFNLTRIWDLKDEKIFKDALISTIVMVIKKAGQTEKTVLKHLDQETVANLFDPGGKIQVESDSPGAELIAKLNSGELLPSIATIRTGVMGFEYWKMDTIITEKDAVNSVRLYTNGNLARYDDKWDTAEINLYKKKIQRPFIELNTEYLNNPTIKLFRTTPKIIVRGVAKKVSAIVDQEGGGLLVAVHTIIPEQGTDIWYLLGLINSNLINWLHLNTFYSLRIPQGSLKYPISFFNNIPIPNASNGDMKTVASHSQKIQKLYDSLKASSENSNEWHSIKSEIEKTDDQIDQLVYKLYNLTPKEIEIVES